MENKEKDTYNISIFFLYFLEVIQGTTSVWIEENETG